MLKIKLDKDPHDIERNMFQNLNREIPKGVTILTGCNGSGKTTFLDYVENKYRKNKEFKVFRFSLHDKDTNRYQALSGNIGLFASMVTSSEGEELNTNIGILASAIGNFVRKEDRNIIILLDSIDSGLSIDNIDDTMSFLEDLLVPDIQSKGREVYVIVCANSYEVVRNRECTDVRTGKTVRFSDYEEYRKYILKSRKKKDS